MLFFFRLLIQFFLSLVCLRIFFIAATATQAESKEEMTSLPTTTPSVQHQFASDIQMEQKQQLLPDRNATEISRMPPDGREFSAKRLSLNGVGEKQQAKRFVEFYFYCFMRA
jgi:hypothetical protein